METKIYLASQSKGRLLVLTNAGYEVTVCPTDCDESGDWDDPVKMVEDLAVRKMEAFMQSGDYVDRTIPAVTSDTVVVLDGKVIGKAHTTDEAIYQLIHLSGRTHTVYSSYCVCKDNQLYHGYDSTDVTFKDIISMIPEYIASKEWRGAAGSYRIQGLGANFIQEIKGDTNTIIGLPLSMVEQIVDNN